MASVRVGVNRRCFGAAALCPLLPAGALLVLAGCASRPTGGGSAPLEPPPRRSAALGRFEAGGPGALAVGAVQPAERSDDASATAVAQALRDALLRDLAAIGVLDAAAPTRVDVALSARRGSAVEAQVTVTRAGNARLKKRYRAEPPALPSSADAPAVLQALLDELYDDPEFNLAVKD